MGRMFRRLFVLAALAGAVAWVAHRLGLAGRRDDDPFEYAPPATPEPPMAETPMPEAAPAPEASGDASADDGKQQPAGE